QFGGGDPELEGPFPRLVVAFALQRVGEDGVEDAARQQERLETIAALERLLTVGQRAFEDRPQPRLVHAIKAVRRRTGDGDLRIARRLRTGDWRLFESGGTAAEDVDDPAEDLARIGVRP